MTTEEWVHSFLLGIGNNKELSDGLKKAQRYWVGPLEINLDTIKRIVGPEDGMEYPESAESWEKRISHMAADIRSGWKPPHLIAEYRSGELSLRDGNHRLGALQMAGVKTHTIVIWFNSEEDFKMYTSKK